MSPDVASETSSEAFAWNWVPSSGKLLIDERLAGFLGVEPAMTGRRLEDLLGIVHPDDRDRVARRTLDTDGGYEHRCRLRSVVGRWHWVRSHARAFTQDSPVRVEGVLEFEPEPEPESQAELKLAVQRSLAQDLAAASIYAETGAAAMAAAPAEVNAMLKSLQEQLQFARDRLGLLLAGTGAPAAQHDASLPVLIAESLIMFQSANPGVRLRVEFLCSRHALTDGVMSTVRFVLHEALLNVAQHTRASLVSVTVTERDGTLTVTVTDDGGAALASPVRESGLAQMRAQAEREGGVFSYEFSDTGAKVSVDVPVTQKPALPCDRPQR